MSPHKISVLVRIDLDGEHVTLVVTGVLTERNQQALVPVAERARTLFPQAAVTVDLEGAVLQDASALDLLRWNLEDGHPGAAPLRITAPGTTAQEHLPLSGRTWPRA